MIECGLHNLQSDNFVRPWPVDRCMHEARPNCLVRLDPKCTGNILIKSPKLPFHKTTQIIGSVTIRIKNCGQERPIHTDRRKQPAVEELHFGEQIGPRPRWFETSGIETRNEECNEAIHLVSQDALYILWFKYNTNVPTCSSMCLSIDSVNVMNYCCKI
jgi:hypothetical protein